jgi:nucleoside-diphosphate-sugar epimerase
MRVLIVGGTGLISTAITRYLIERGHAVTLYNRGQRESATPDGLARIVGDRANHAAFEAQIAQAGTFDCVIDMICFTPAEAESAIRAFRGRTTQYIFCSTVDVYTKPARRYPILEQAERQPKMSFMYAYNKAACERLFEAAGARGDFTTTFIRPAHTYGPGGRLLHTLGFGTYLISRLRAGKPIIVQGDGKSLWAACHRDDVGLAFANAVGNGQAFGQAYHVASEEWLTWDRYYQAVAEAMGAPVPEIVHIPADFLSAVAPQEAMWCVENFQFPNIFDNAAARRDLGFRYTIPWIEGVRGVIGWLEERGLVEDWAAQPFYDVLLGAWRQAQGNVAAALAPYSV